MKIPRLIIYIALSFVVTATCLLLLGRGGLSDYRKLAGYKASLEANIADLRKTNRALLAELDALGSDPERITLQARELGYFREGERVMRGEGFRLARNYYTVGRLLRRAPDSAGNNWPLRLIGMGLPAALCAISLAVRRSRKREAGHR